MAAGVWLTAYDTSTGMFTNSQLREDIFYCGTRDLRDNTLSFNGSYVAVCDHDKKFMECAWNPHAMRMQ
eukprot:6132247-Prymnesium_polylepis.1